VPSCPPPAHPPSHPPALPPSRFHFPSPNSSPSALALHRPLPFPLIFFSR
jgi:hypothetical protein